MFAPKSNRQEECNTTIDTQDSTLYTKSNSLSDKLFLFLLFYYFKRRTKQNKFYLTLFLYYTKNKAQKALHLHSAVMSWQIL